MIKLNKKDTVVFIGDSITHGGRGLCMDLNHIMGHGYAEMVCARLAADNLENMPKFINKGISGQTTQDIAARWDEDVIKYRPNVVSLLTGINDIMRNLNAPVEEFVKKYLDTVEMLIKKTKDALPDVKIILCEPIYLDSRTDGDPYEDIPSAKCEADFIFGNINTTDETVKNYYERLAPMQKELPNIAKKYGLAYVPFQDIFDEWAKKVAPSYLIWDNVHPTMAGHRLMADRWLETVEF